MRRACLLLSFALMIGTCTPAAAAGSPKALTPYAAKLISGSPEQLLAACRADLDRARAARKALVAMKSRRDLAAVLDGFEAITLPATDAAMRADLAKQVLSSKPAREAAERCEQEATNFLTDISLDRSVYDILASLDPAALDPAAQFVIRGLLRDYRRAGVDKDDATRGKIRELNQELVKISQEFARNIAGDVRKIEFAAADLDGLPDDYKATHAPAANGKVTLTTDNTDFFPFMKYANRAQAREAFYRLYMHKGYPSNMDVLARMFAKRYELARLLGNRNWADYVLANKMAGSTGTVSGFIDKVARASDARSHFEYDELLAAKKQVDPAATAIDAWDILYLQQLVSKEKYAFDARQARPYFEYSHVKQALLDVTARMYGISYRPAPDAVVWDKDVESYDVFDGDTRLGRIYFDLFPRENKYKHYATFFLSLGKREVELPEVVLVCNFPRPGKDPALMEYNDVVTFFHEYGHLLNAIFAGQNRWLGAEMEWDSIEVASQILEEWARDPLMLRSYARHYKTNEAIPPEMIRAMRRANEFGKGINMHRQMVFAAVSLHYYDRDPAGLDTSRMMADTWNQYMPCKYPDGVYFQTQFGHLDGYSAAYYTYAWSLVIAKDAFGVFRDKGLLDRDTATRFRRSVLAPRGTKSAHEQFEDFLGRPYSFQAFEDWMNSD